MRRVLLQDVPSSQGDLDATTVTEDLEAERETVTEDLEAEKKTVTEEDLKTERET